MLVDTHCHIHDADYGLDAETVLTKARKQSVKKVICVGTDVASSTQAVSFAEKHEGVYATIGLHPNDVATPVLVNQLETLTAHQSVVAIGECGLDYYYDRFDRTTSQQLLRAQFELARQQGLPMVFHLRGSKDDPEDAFSDFWPIYDEYGVPGVIHSFSSTAAVAEQAIQRGLLLGLNGIITFMKADQLAVITDLPLNSVILETDAPLLTPAPFRGTINEPKHIRVIAEFLSQLRGEPAKQIAASTSNNAIRLFNI